jgi:hypothetical protein
MYANEDIDHNVYQYDSSDAEERSQNGGPISDEEPEEIEIERPEGMATASSEESSSEESSSSSDSEERPSRPAVQPAREPGPAPQPARRKLKIQFPRREDKFPALDEKDLDVEKMLAFWRNYSAHAEREGYTEARKIEVLGKKLAGNSLLYFNELVRLNVNTYADITKRILERRFGPQSKEDRKARMKDIKFTNGTKDMAVEYFRRKEEAVRYYDNNVDADSLVDYLVAGTKGWMCHDDLKKEARRLKREKPKEGLVESLLGAMIDLARDGKKKEVKEAKVSFVGNSFTGVCYTCGKSGHKSAECKSKLPSDRSRSYLPAARGSPDYQRAKNHAKDYKQKKPVKPQWNDKKRKFEETKKSNDSVVCYNCRHEGHVFAECFYKDTRVTGGKLEFKDEYARFSDFVSKKNSP